MKYRLETLTRELIHASLAVFLFFTCFVSYALASKGSALKLMNNGLVAEEKLDSHENTAEPSPVHAMLRSFVMPGWGHYYVDSGHWRRGQFHLGAEMVLLASYLGINRQAYVLDKNMYTFAAAYSGVDIQNMERDFEIAVGNFPSLEAYNDYQERTRNFNRIFPDTPGYRWEWESDTRRTEYRNMRSRRDNLNNQLPTLAVFMVVNRLLSGVSAYARARSAVAATSTVYVIPVPDRQGFEARISISF